MSRNLKYSILVVLTIVCMALNACSEREEAIPLPSDEQPVKFSFRIITSTEKDTRDSSGEADITVKAYGEDFIDVDDVVYLLFDGETNFLSRIDTSTTTVAANDSFTIYDVVAEITDPYFKSNTNGELEFYILALVNLSTWGVTLPQLDKGDSIDKLFSEGIKLTKLPVASKLKDPMADGRQLFPMAGIQRFKVPGNMFLTTWDGLPYDLTRATGEMVKLLRALAKIEIIDKINVREGASFTSSDAIRIESVSLNGYMAEGLLLPGKANWQSASYLETQQVISPSVTGENAYTLSPLSSSTPTAIDFIKDDIASETRQDKCPVFSAYIFEYSKAILTGSTVHPHVLINFNEYKNPETGVTEVEKSTFELTLTSSDSGGNVTDINSILRNHIYRFEISGVAAMPEVKWEICPMDKVEADIIYN